MRTATRTLLLALLPSLLCGCAALEKMQETHRERRFDAAAEKLAASPDADSLAAAGALLLARQPQRALALLRRATEAAPERTDLAWLQASACEAKNGCDREAMDRKLRALDATNGAGWLAAVARADASGDETAKDEALAAISRSQRVDTYWTTLVAKLSRAMVRTGLVPLPEAEVQVIGILAAEALPGYSATSNACKGERLQSAGVIDTCRGVAHAFRQGDTYITEMVGVAIARRVWPEGAPEWNSAVEARRSFEGRSALVAKVDPPWNRGAAERYLALCERNAREQDVLKAQLLAAGKKAPP